MGETIVLPEYYKNGKDFINQYGIIKKEKLNFYLGDNQELYEKNLKKMPPDWIYKNRSITYNLNSCGYRCDEFNSIDWKNSIVILGCSYVFGLGVDETETLSYQLSLLTGKNVVNLGVVGASNQLLLDMSIILKKNYDTPLSLIILWTSTIRYPYYSSNELYNVGPWYGYDKHPWYKTISNKFLKIFNLLYSEKSHEIITFRNIKDAFKYIWIDKVQYYEGTFFNEISNYGDIEMVFYGSKTARDLLHPGCNDYKKVAEILYKKYYEINE